MTTRELIEKLVFNHFRIALGRDEALKVTAEKMAMFDKEFVNKAELREKLEEVRPKNTKIKFDHCNPSCHESGKDQALTDIKNLDILK